MNKKRNSELSRMFEFAGNRHWLTVAGCILSGLSTVLSMIPFVCIWFVIRDILHAMVQGDFHCLVFCCIFWHYAVHIWRHFARQPT